MAGETHLIRAYGDRRDDGVIQLSFTLPVPLSDKAKEAARRFCTELGLLDVKVACGRAGRGQLHLLRGLRPGGRLAGLREHRRPGDSSSRSSGSTS